MSSSGSLATKGGPAGGAATCGGWDELVERRAEGVEIGAVIDRAVHATAFGSPARACGLTGALEGAHFHLPAPSLATANTAAPKSMICTAPVARFQTMLEGLMSPWITCAECIV